MSTYPMAFSPFNPPSLPPNYGNIYNPNQNPYVLGQQTQTTGTQGTTPAPASTLYGTPNSDPYSGFDPLANNGAGNNPDTSQYSGFTGTGNEAISASDASSPASDPGMQNILAANRDTINTTGNLIGQEAGNQLNYYGAQQADYTGAENSALNQLATTPGYTAAQSNAIMGNPNAAASQLGSELQTAQGAFNPLNTAVNNPNLQVSNQDVSNIETQAGETVGNQFRGAEDTLEQQAAAAGNTSPAALAAMRQQLLTQEGSSAGTAMANADIAAQQYQLGATQQQTGLQATAATTEEAAAQAAASQTGNAQIAAENQDSQRAQTVANQAIAGQGAYRSGVTTAAQTSQQGGQAAVNQQEAAYGTQTSGANASAGTQAGYDTATQGMSLGNKLTTSVANLFAEGGVSDGGMAKVAEKGPEWVGDVNALQRESVRGSGRYGRRRRMEDPEMFGMAA